MTEKKQSGKPKRKPVYFPTRDAYDRRVLAHAEVDPLTKEERVFSKYVWRLIEEDMRRVVNGDKIVIQQGMDDEPIVRKEKDAYTLEVMGGYL